MNVDGTRYYLARSIGAAPATMRWESQAVSLVPVVQVDTILNGVVDKSIMNALIMKKMSVRIQSRKQNLAG